MSPYHSLVGKIEQYDGVVYVVTGEDEAGCVVFGPYVVLDPGNYEVEFYVMPGDMSSKTACVVDVLRGGLSITTERDFKAGELINRNGLVRLRFEVIATDTFEFRVMATGHSALTVRYQRPLRRLPDPVRPS